MVRESEPTTTDRLRADIDSGKTGDKVAGSDPAAAPLGADAEAGGTPPSRHEIEIETQSRHVDPPQQSRWRPSISWLAAAAVLAAVIVLFGVFGTE